MQPILLRVHPLRQALFHRPCSAGNSQFNRAFAANWGDGSPSSSDGQRFRAEGRGQSTGTLTLSKATNRDGCSIPKSPTNTHHSALVW